MPPAADIGVEADELRPLVGGADRALGQHAADDVGLLVVGGLQPLEHLLLALMIAGDGEGHELVERHAVLGIDVEQRRRDRRELQALLHHVDRDEEGGGDLLLGLALLAQRQEGPELVERMERRALDVLGERVLLGDAAFADDAGHRRGLGEALLLHQQLQRPVAPAAGRDLEHAGLDAGLVDDGSDAEALQAGRGGRCPRPAPRPRRRPSRAGRSTG